MPPDACHYPNAGRKPAARPGRLGPLSARRGLTKMVAGARTFSLEETFLSPQILNPPPTRHALLAFLLALTALLHIGTTAWGDLFDGVEGQFAVAARAMAASGNWLVPTNDGGPVLNTPPLAYWAGALFFNSFGIS